MFEAHFMVDGIMIDADDQPETEIKNKSMKNTKVGFFFNKKSFLISFY